MPDTKVLGDQPTHRDPVLADPDPIVVDHDPVIVDDDGEVVDPLRLISGSWGGSGTGGVGTGSRASRKARKGHLERRRVRRVRVAVVTDGIYPYSQGGKEVRYHELLRRIVGPAVSIDVYTQKWWDGDEKVREQDGMTFHALCRNRSFYSGQRRSMVQAVVFALACLRLVTADFDLIDADHAPYLQVIPLRLVAWIKRVPLLVTWHEWWEVPYWRAYMGRLGYVAAAIERLAARLADRIVVVSSTTRDRMLADNVSPRKVMVLPNGVDLEAVDAAPAVGSYDCVFVSRLIDHKRPDVLIAALGRLRQEGLRLTCAIVGFGPAEKQLRAQVRALGLEHDVHFLGRLPSSEDVYGLMKGARVFAHPSVREGYGLVVAEALACGTPVVTSDHPDNAAGALVCDGVNGYVTVSEPAAFAEGIRRAIQHPPAPEAIRASARDLDWAPMAEDLASTYRALAG